MTTVTPTYSPVAALTGLIKRRLSDAQKTFAKNPNGTNWNATQRWMLTHQQWHFAQSRAACRDYNLPAIAAAALANEDRLCEMIVQCTTGTSIEVLLERY